MVYIKEIGIYRVIAATQDDALGEALDKAARMLGLGYPGGAFLEKLAREGRPPAAGSELRLPLPMAGREDKNKFSYSGLKTAMWRLTQDTQNTNEKFTKQTICDLSALFQDMAFKHLIRVIRKSIENENIYVKDLLVGGGVIANIELRHRLRQLAKEMGMIVHFPRNKKLCGDNAGMIGVAAAFKITNHKSQVPIDQIDRKPRWKVEEV